MKIDHQWVDAYFQNGIDIVNRRVFLDSDIDNQSVGNAIKGLYLMETESKTERIEIFISSYGGSIYDALALYDIMNTISCPIHTFAYGVCMSAAPILLAAGEPGYRWVSPSISFMHHDWWAELDGSGKQLTGLVKHFNHISEVWTDILVKHSNKDSRWWNNKAGKGSDFYFHAQEAIEWGLADNIWSEK